MGTNNKKNNLNTDTPIWTKGFAGLFIANLVIAVAFYFLLSTLPVYFTKYIHTNGLQTGVLLASYSVAAIITRPFTGYFIDIYGRKWIYLAALCIMTLLINLYPWVGGFLLMFILRFSHGLTWGIISTTGSTIAVDMLPEKKRGQGVGIYGLSMTLAMAVGPLIGLSIVHSLSYFWLFSTGFALSLAGTLIAFSIGYPKYLNHKKSKFHFKNLFEKTSIPLSVNMFLLMIPYGGIISFIVLYAKELGIENAGLFFFIYAIGVGISRFTSGKVFDSKGPDGINTFAMSMNAVGFITLSLIRSPAGFYSSAFIIGIGNGIIFPIFQTMVTNIVPANKRGTAISTLFTAFDMGLGAGMVLIGYISDITGLASAYMVNAFIAAIALVYYLLYAGKKYNLQLKVFSGK